MTNQPHNKNPGRVNQQYKLLIGLLFTLLLSISVAGGYWLFNSQSGLQWTFSVINRLGSGVIKFEGVHGTLRNMQIAAIHFANDAVQLAMQNVHIAWNPNILLQKQIEINQISVEAMNIQILPSTTEAPPPTLPENLTIPLALSIHSLTIDSMHRIPAADQNPDLIISNLTLSLDSTGRHHQLTNLNFRTPWGAFSALAELDGNSPFALSAQIDLSDADAWGDTRAAITGSLAQMDIQITAKQTTVKRNLAIQLQPFAANPVTQFHAILEALNPAAFLPDSPTANLSLHANLATNESGQLEGKIQIENRAANTLNSNGLPFSLISTQALVTAEFLELQDIHVHIAADNILSGNLTWHRTEESGSARLLVNKLNPQHIDSRIRAAQVSGKIQLDGNTRTQSARINLKDSSVALNAAITRTDEHITLEQFNLQRNKSRLTGQGKLTAGEAQSFELSGNLINFNIADFIQAPDSNLNAMINLTGKLSPQVSGVLKYSIPRSHLAKSPVTGAGHIAFNGFKQFNGKAELTIGANHLLVQGGIGKADDVFQLSVNAPALEQIGLDLAGDLQTHIKLGGNLESPDLHINIKSRQLYLSGNQRFSGITADGHLNTDTLSLQAAIGNYAADDKTILQQLTIDTHGKISNHTLLVKTQINNESEIRLKATGGMYRKTQSQSLRWNGQLAELSATGKVPVRLMAPTPFSLSSEFISLGHAKFSISGGFINLDQLQWTPKNWKTHGHFSGIALLPGMHEELTQPTLQLGGHWDFVSASQLTGNLHIHRELGDWYLPGEMSQPLGLETLQLKVAAQNGEITGEFELFSKLIGTANAQLTVATKQLNNRWSIADEAPLNGKVITRVTDLKWLDAILGDSMSMSGQLQVQANIKGTLKQPDFAGTASGKELSILLLEQGVNLQQGTLVANFRHTNLTIERLDFIAPHEPPPDKRLFKELKLENTSGSLAINGNIGLAGNESHLDFKIKQLPLTHKTDYWIIASGSGQARFYHNNLSVKGDISADAGLLLQPPEDRPELSEDIVFVNSPGNAQQKLSLLLDVNLNLGEKFYLRASGLEGRLAGQLQVQNDKSNALKVNGSIAAQDTTFKAYGQNLTVKRGIVSFQGPLDDPGLNILAVREGLPIEAGIEIMGSVRHPQVKLVSTPNVPDTEKLSWIVLGRKPEAGGLDTSALLAAAGSILGGRSGGGITEQIRTALGVDEVTVKQAGIGSSLSGQIGVIGKRISSRTYLSYERSLATTTMGITKLTYNLTPKITVVTQAGEDSAVDLFYTIQFD